MPEVEESGGLTAVPRFEVCQNALKSTLGSFVTGVTIVTSLDGKGNFNGMTVSAFCSLSLHPPMVLLCLTGNSRTVNSIRESKRFVVHILKDTQEQVAREFAVRGRPRESILRHNVNAGGYPILEDFHSALECRLSECRGGGDHEIILGFVERTHDRTGASEPLIHYKSRLGGLGRVRSGGTT